MKWYYKGEVYDPTYEDIPEDVLGFVYIITEIETGKKYVGQKRMRKPKTLPITKSRLRRVKTIVESDWRTYYSSSSIIKEDVVRGLSRLYEREIIRFCGSKGDLNYIEAKEQIERNMLFDPLSLNGLINCKIHRKHISKKLRLEEGFEPL